MEETLRWIFPAEMQKVFETVCLQQSKISEIRLRAMRPILIRRSGEEWFVEENGRLTKSPDPAAKISVKQLQTILDRACQNSPYAYEEELKNGFLTIRGGHRIGVTGQVVAEGEKKIRTQKYITGLNIRVAHEVSTAADDVLSQIYRKGQVLSVLILSPPGCGKTTFLRALIRRVSDGNPYGGGKNVGVVDERSEIAGAYQGEFAYDLGMRTDVLDACPKQVGISLLLRSMSPEVIAVDEIGEQGDYELLRKLSTCGCKLFATAHGDSLQDILRKFMLTKQELGAVFDRVVLLEKRDGKCQVKAVEALEDEACI